MARRRLRRPKPLGKAVTGSIKLVDGVTKLENQQWLPYLTKIVDGKRIGLNPKLIDPDILTAAGHPPRPATNRIKAYLKDLGKIPHPKRDRFLPRLVELCRDCSGSIKASKDCAIINCPLWLHRFGNNPHNYHKKQNEEE